MCCQGLGLSARRFQGLLARAARSRRMDLRADNLRKAFFHFACDGRAFHCIAVAVSERPARRLKAAHDFPMLNPSQKFQEYS
jgi:hypothetical protein